MNTTKAKPVVTIEFGDSLCERGNTWLTNGENHVAWFREGKTTWLEIAINPQNYPGFEIQVIDSTEEELCQHIHEKCHGWYSRKCNILGVNLDGVGEVENPNLDDED